MNIKNDWILILINNNPENGVYETADFAMNPEVSFVREQ
jgi:hypothetical protein